MIKLDTAEVRAGGVLKGSASWDDPPRGSTRATLWLVYRTEVHVEVRQGRIPRSGDSVRAEGDYCLVAQQHVEADGAAVRFEFAIPKEGPLTYNGKLMRVIWELVAGKQAGVKPKVTERAAFKVSAPPAAT